MTSSKLLTKYLLASNQAKLIYFLCFYFIIYNFYTFDLAVIANCASNTDLGSSISTNDKLVQYFFSENVIKKQEETIIQQEKEIQSLQALCVGITILFVFFSFR